MLFLVVVSILLTRNLKVDHISRRQAILEPVSYTHLYRRIEGDFLLIHHIQNFGD